MEYSVKDIKYGLIVLDTRNKDDEYFDILHFCGYITEPSLDDANNLREELRDDPEFGLQDIWDIVEILPAPDYIVQKYLDDLKDE